MNGHFCLVPRVSVHDRYYCISIQRERERDRERGGERERERDREKERKIKKERERDRERILLRSIVNMMIHVQIEITMKDYVD